MVGMKFLRTVLKKNRVLFAIIRSLIEKFSRFKVILFSVPLHFLKVKKNKVVITSFYGKQYSDNPKYILKELLRRNRSLEIVWLVDKRMQERLNIPIGVKVVYYSSFRALYELATAKIWVDNCRKTIMPYKKKTQMYLQTWHGTPWKKIEGDAKDKLNKYYIKSAIKDSNSIDVLISGNTHCTKIFEESFFYKGKVYEIGTPRNDILVNNEYKSRRDVLDLYGLHSKKLVLYAPTFRNEEDKNVMYQLDALDPLILLEALQEKYKEEFLLITRFHPNVVHLINVDEINEKFKGKVFDVSLHDDGQEILLIADILITDYSSIIFDYALLDRPIVLFISDAEEYLNERGLYFSFEEFPLKKAASNLELVNVFSDTTLQELAAETNMLKKMIGDKEKGTATHHTAKLIEDYIFMDK